jgi:hypothetical protein
VTPRDKPTDARTASRLKSACWPVEQDGAITAPVEWPLQFGVRFAGK